MIIEIEWIEEEMIDIKDKKRKAKKHTIQFSEKEQIVGQTSGY